VSSLPLMFLSYIVRLGEVKSQDAVYILAFSVIMLNTDQHNPQVRVGLASSYDSPFSELVCRTACLLSNTRKTSKASMLERIFRLTTW
jgi:hypothetical protein